MDKTIMIDGCKCGKESTRGGHWVDNGVVKSEHYCDDCYNKREFKGTDEKESIVE